MELTVAEILESLYTRPPAELISAAQAAAAAGDVPDWVIALAGANPEEWEDALYWINYELEQEGMFDD